MEHVNIAKDGGNREIVKSKKTQYNTAYTSNTEHLATRNSTKPIANSAFPTS
jgi:hypothetical protein